MNRYSFLNLFKKPAYVEHAENNEEYTINSLDAVVKLGREFHRDGYTDIMPCDDHKSIRLGYLFRNPKNDFHVIIRFRALCLKESKYLSEFNNERGRHGFIKVFSE